MAQARKCDRCGININDFKPGQDAFMLLENTGRTEEPEIEKVVVLSIGRKYVKVAKENSRNEIDFFSNFDEENFLLENVDWGEKRKLFPDRQAVEDYLERGAIYRDLRDLLKFYNEDDFTLEQLRKAKRILEAE